MGDMKYWEKHENGDARLYELRAEAMIAWDAPGLDDRFVNVLVTKDDRVVINQNPEPHNPSISAEAIAELAEAIAQQKATSEQ